MESRTSFKKDWILNQDAFDALLARLDPDRDRAAQQYEHIRRALITFFECRGSATPEDHTDTTINRVARRILEGKEIHSEAPSGYFIGVARNVLKESWDASTRTPGPLESVPPAALPAVDPHRVRHDLAERRRLERRLDCLSRCLDALTPEHRELIDSYYRGQAGSKIQNRKRMAKRLGIPINALRIRALRIREQLESCVIQCMNRS